MSLFSLYESHEARVSTVRDKLLLRARRPMGDQPISIRKSAGELHFGSVAVPWELLLSNTGNSTVSITRYEVSQIDGNSSQVLYSGLDRGLFSPEGNQPVSLPMVLEAGKSVRLLAVVGLNPGRKAYTTMAETIQGNEATVSLSSIEGALAKRGIDLYDNPVAPYISDGAVIGWRVEQQGKEQVFLFKMNTARGAVVTEVSSWYDLKRY